MASRKLADPKPGDNLGYGQGSLIWDKQRPGFMLLKHSYNGRRYTERGRSWAEVNGKRRDRLDAVGALDRLGLVDGTLAALAQAWLGDIRRSKGLSLAGETDNGYVWALGYITAQLGDVPAAKLDRAMVRRMFVALASDPVKPLGGRSLLGIRNTLSMVVDFGIEQHWMTTNPVRGMKMPEAAARPKPKRWLDLDEYDTVRRHLVAEHSTAHALYLVMLQCGLRPGEARGLRWDAVDFEGRALRVESAMRKDRNGKSAPSSTLKTDRHGDAARRAIPMTQELIAVLRRERTEQFARGITEYVFESVGKSEFDEEAGRIARATGVRYVNPNGYRHTFASVCRHRGMPYEQLAKLMGHKSVRMIIEVYGHPLTQPSDIDMNLYLAGANGALPYLDDAEEG